MSFKTKDLYIIKLKRLTKLYYTDTNIYGDYTIHKVFGSSLKHIFIAKRMKKSWLEEDYPFKLITSGNTIIKHSYASTNLEQSDVGTLCYFDPTPLGIYYPKNKLSLKMVKSLEDYYNRKEQPANSKIGAGEKVFYTDLDNYDKQS